MELSILVPVFNEEDNIIIMQERIRKTILQIAERYPEAREYEVIYVNDGSKDESLSRSASLFLRAPHG